MPSAPAAHLLPVTSPNPPPPTKARYSFPTGAPARPRRRAAEPQRGGAAPSRTRCAEWSSRKCTAPRGLSSPTARGRRGPTCPSAAPAMVGAAGNCARPR